MLINLLLGLPVMAACLILQSLLVVAALRFHAHRRRRLHYHSLRSAVQVLTGVMLILILGNVAQILVWGGLFLVLGEFDDFNLAVYHSAVNFATLGYGDIIMSEKHALLGPLEALNGALMIGLSTAALLTSFQNAWRQVFAEDPPP